jgi:leucine-rich repeat protein SHOC2
VHRSQNSKLHRTQGLEQVPFFFFSLSLNGPIQFETIHLQSLSAVSNLLKSIPTEIFGLEQLKLLTVSHNQITSIPAEIESAKQLTKLEASHNKLVSLPELCQSINYIVASHNVIERLPVFHLPNILSLDLSNNSLQALPENFLAHMPQLSVLELSCNQLTSFGDELGVARELKELSLRRNKLTHIGASIGQFESLESLTISENPLTQIQPATFQVRKYY